MRETYQLPKVKSVTHSHGEGKKGFEGLGWGKVATQGSGKRGVF